MYDLYILPKECRLKFTLEKIFEMKFQRLIQGINIYLICRKEDCQCNPDCCPVQSLSHFIDVGTYLKSIQSARKKRNFDPLIRFLKMFVCVSDKTDENGAVIGIAWDSSYLKTILGRLTLGAIVSLHKYSKVFTFLLYLV